MTGFVILEESWYWHNPNSETQVGKDTFDLDLKILARTGSLISFGNASGA